ncbi:hypothetical protein SAMN04487934_11323 [Eubacterium ruminantium]|nr:hypothetical protein SAMN04487934_11323 [Eubacterium ruminantium]
MGWKHECEYYRPGECEGEDEGAGGESVCGVDNSKWGGFCYVWF